MISEKTYLWLLAALGGERIFELLLSRRNAVRAFARGGKEVGSEHYPIMVLFHTLFFVFCAVESRLRGASVPASVFWAAVTLASVAQVLRYTAVWTLGDRWNTRVIVEPGCAPVTGGIYRWIRHPNYLGVILETAAIPLIGGAWATALVFSLGQLWLLAMRISVEEQALGKSYAGEFAERPRFIPIGRSNGD